MLPVVSMCTKSLSSMYYPLTLPATNATYVCQRTFVRTHSNRTNITKEKLIFFLRSSYKPNFKFLFIVNFLIKQDILLICKSHSNFLSLSEP